MKRKASIGVIITVFVLTLTITTCELFNKEMNLILPIYLYDEDYPMNEGDGMVEIYDSEETDTIVELKIVTTDGNEPEYLSKILKIPPYAIIAANELSIVFKCETINTEMGSPNYTDITVMASALHYNDAEDTIRIHDVTPVPTDEPTPDARPKCTPVPIDIP